MPSIYSELVDKRTKLAVVGLGYVGLPIALEFAKKVNVIGFDIDAGRIALMQRHIDPSGELTAADFEGRDIVFTDQTSRLKEATFFIVAVPTPIDGSKAPNLTPLLTASSTVGQVLKKGDYVVYESTVYPGCTEEDCIPVLEATSGLTFKTDFKVGYSPERINPGDKVHTLSSIVKVAAGCDEEAAENIVKTYELVVQAGVHRSATIKIAEAAKVIENTQRDVNIALVNELSIIFNRLGIDTHEVLKAAATKWNFLEFWPGLVGGHCIGIDPYYLTHKAKKAGYHAKIINSGRYINDSMGFYVGKQTVKKIIARGKNPIASKVLIMGVTFKENVSDVRNSKIVDVVQELESFACTVHLVDPYADPEEVLHAYGFSLRAQPDSDYDAVVVAVNHRSYAEMEEGDFRKLMRDDKGVLVDLKGTYKEKIQQMEYWSL